MRIVGLIASLFIITSCTHQPGYTFLLDNGSLKGHSESVIEVEQSDTIQLRLDSAIAGFLKESVGSFGDSICAREILLYAKIYKNGYFLEYKKITDIATDMCSYKPFVIQNDIIFTGTADDFYQIELKGYEVDTKALVRFLRRTQKVDIDTLEGGPFNPGSTFASGFKAAITGAFDMLFSVTGRSIDDWAAKVSADLFLHHTIYIAPRSHEVSPITTDVGGSSKEYFLVVGNAYPGMTCSNKDCYSKSNLKSGPIYSETGADLNTAVTDLSTAFKLDDLRSGSYTNLAGLPYLLIEVRRKDFNQ